MLIENNRLKAKPDMNTVHFGSYFTDYMFTMTYQDGKWQNLQIKPYADISISPANTTIHYGQSVFEGMKAYKRADDEVLLFRPMDHLRRLNNSARILDIPEIDVEKVYEALLELIDIERAWVPKGKGQSLYIRPFIFATDGFLGVNVSKTYEMYIILCPVAAYYAHGFAPVKIMVEDQYTRAVQGGLGEAKTAANYAASLHAGLVAHEKGFDQTLWLDGKGHHYVEEVGSMNIFFKIDDKIFTPRLDGSILNGMTRRTVLQIARDWGYVAEEKTISITDIIKAHEEGKLEEAFGTGTAAVISPVGQLHYKGRDFVINGGKVGPFAQRMFDYITDLQNGTVEDKYHFTCLVPRKND